MRFFFLAAVLAALLAAMAGPPSTAQAANCQFVLGFKALHDAIPAIVGNCRADEHHNALNGDGLQETTGPTGAGGLLVWRKLDNWTAFTDGYHTWLNGPSGLQERLNSQRFCWEGDAAANCLGPIPNNIPRDEFFYLKSRLGAALTAYQGVQGLADQSKLVVNNPSLLNDQGWMTETAFDLTLIKSGGTALQQQIPVPADMVGVDDLLRSTGGDLVATANDFGAGLAARDPSLIQQAITHLDSANTKMTLAVSDLKTALAKYGIPVQF